MGFTRGFLKPVHQPVLKPTGFFEKPTGEFNLYVMMLDFLSTSQVLKTRPQIDGFKKTRHFEDGFLKTRHFEDGFFKTRHFEDGFKRPVLLNTGEKNPSTLVTGLLNQY